MTYELFQQGAEVYIPILLLSLVITVFAYGAFPFIFAKTRNKPITKKKYRRMCYGINVAVMFLFIVINGGASNGAPYLLWTWVFTNWGTKILDVRGILVDESYKPDVPNHLPELNNKPVVDADKIQFCRKCGERLIENSRFCRKCGTEIVD